MMSKDWTVFADVVLLTAVVLLAAGLLAYFIGRSRTGKRNRDEKEERK